MDASNSLVIETRNLSKAYKGVQALKDFNLKLTPGILGLLGPNGAGKSTLMRMLATITKPTEGTILWNGTDVVKNPEALRPVLGYLPQDFGVYPNLSAQEFLEYMAAIKGMSGEKAHRKISDLLDLVNLRKAARRSTCWQPPGCCCSPPTGGVGRYGCRVGILRVRGLGHGNRAPAGGRNILGRFQMYGRLANNELGSKVCYNIQDA